MKEHIKHWYPKDGRFFKVLSIAGNIRQVKDFIGKKYGISRCQNSHAAEHNCKVAEIICSLDKREIDTVQAEWQTRDQMQEALEQMRQEGDYDQYDYYMDLWKSGLVSAVDVVYTSAKTGEMVCCENSYKDSDIQGKEYCGEILQTEIEYVRV